MMPSAGPSAGSSRTVGKSFAVVAVKALVPYEKQWEEYERTLNRAVEMICEEYGVARWHPALGQELPERVPNDVWEQRLLDADEEERRGGE